MATQKEVLSEVYDSMLVVAGACGISFLSQKLMKKNLGTPTSFEGVGKLALAVGVSSAVVKVLQKKEMLPKNPWKA